MYNYYKKDDSEEGKHQSFRSVLDEKKIIVLPRLHLYYNVLKTVDSTWLLYNIMLCNFYYVALVCPEHSDGCLLQS